MENSSIIKNLNAQQQFAVKIKEGPVLVLAGAGSGKTRVLTHRIAYLISLGVSPMNILGITFTNKAAAEMKGRVKNLLTYENLKTDKKDQQQGGAISFAANSRFLLPILGTFHSICVRILRKEIKLLGMKPGFNIYDDDDKLRAVKAVMDDLNLNLQKINPRVIMSLISSAKNELLGPDKYEKYAKSQIEKLAATIYYEYQKFLQKNQGQDFDDLIMSTVKIFQKHPRVLKYYQHKFRHILVDEYQDTNQAQYQFLNLLAKKHRNIFVVGDDWQSIYGWRGANIQNILNFEKDYQNTETVKLERNYRSTQNILDAAHHVIAKNYSQKKKKLWTKNNQGDKVILYEARDGEEEGIFIIKEIDKIIKNKGKKFGYNNFVILYRTNVQSRALEEVFLHHNIPYKIIGGLRFYERKEIKDTLAYLKIIQNGQDSISLKRIINVPARGIGEVNFKRIIDYASKSNGDLYEGIKLFLSEKKNERLEKLYQMILSAKSKSKKEKVTRLIDYLLDKSGYKDYILDGTEEGEIRWENIQELKSVANNYDGLDAADRLPSFLEEISLLSDADQIDENEEAVTLMTVHSAKGLEYEVVFMAGMEENIFPHSRSLLEANELEEERRLCYVGMTRAKSKLYLLYAQAREMYGGIQTNPPSRFIEDIPEILLDIKGYNGAFGGSYNSSIEVADEEIQYIDEELNIGDKVLHPTFGEGVIKKIGEGVFEVSFSRFGLKKLAKDYAPVKKLED